MTTIDLLGALLIAAAGIMLGQFFGNVKLYRVMRAWRGEAMAARREQRFAAVRRVSPHVGEHTDYLPRYDEDVTRRYPVVKPHGPSAVVPAPAWQSHTRDTEILGTAGLDDTTQRLDGAT